MKVTESTGDGKLERTVLIGMITDSVVAGRIAAKWNKSGLFASKWSNIIGSWCVKYHNKYDKAPGRAVESLFASWAGDNRDKETVALVEKFLTSLNGQYARMKKQSNSNYVIDLAGEYFNKVRLAAIAEALRGDIDLGKVDEGWKRLQELNHKVEIGAGSGIKVLQEGDEGKILRTILDDTTNEVLVKYPGPLGKFIGRAFERDAFVSFMGPEKSGKTFWLLDVGWRGMLQRRRVAFFEVGDLSERQILRRFYTRALGRPISPTKPERPVMYPTTIGPPGDDGGVEINHDHRTYEKAATSGMIQKALVKIMDNRIKSRDDYLRLSVHPNSSITVAGVRSILREWVISDNWIPDVVIIDYADILAAPAGFQGESRDAINENWKAMRRMSQELHCCVVTATQANAASYTSEHLGMQNFSEDKRKFSHVTGMIGINHTTMDKKQRTQRLNWLVLREDEFLVSDEVITAPCLAIANPAVLSVF